MSQPASPAPAAVCCPECRHEVRYYDAVHSAFFGCPHCRTLFEYPETGAPKKLRKFRDIPGQQPVLALGSVGRLEDKAYRVTGYMWRCEAKNASYRWEEFQLREEGSGSYRQLAVFQGHWLLITTTEEQYRVSTEGVLEAPDTDFRLYNRYSPRILYAEGEFDWNVLADESLTISEYISPPLMLVRERQNKNYNHWFKARHLEPQEVAEAFGLPPEQLPYRSGVGSAQPAPGESAWPALRTFSLLMALLVVLTHVYLVLWGNERVFNQQFTSEVPVTTDTAQVGLPITGATQERQPLVSPSFTVPGTGALTVKLYGEVNNTWVEVPFTLVNEQTGQQFAGTSSLEYYFGVEEGESWSEGTKQQELLLNMVPAGRYHLNFYPITDPVNNFGIVFRATVEARATAGSNAVLALVVLLLYPGILYVRRILHERGRWESSDFSPYASSDS
ncbi:DUF4178 domain-containing protein [Hymenobacter metallilatus]|uniref:DUF4178 domain-containing protein n=1 Tax=Hymenobacter metallilatus TaxID=2493666 RepID=A0A3R9M1E7_9BACT|nr:DUF4178 domain-containing protein [Hymenobacter metallilatus]RSK33829.1 DUF4178 domain-containing protein [Hymenobacter metallilatus]